MTNPVIAALANAKAAEAIAGLRERDNAVEDGCLPGSAQTPSSGHPCGFQRMV